jgi:hypothetical protein
VERTSLQSAACMLCDRYLCMLRSSQDDRSVCTVRTSSTMLWTLDSGARARPGHSGSCLLLGTAVRSINDRSGVRTWCCTILCICSALLYIHFLSYFFLCMQDYAVIFSFEYILNFLVLPARKKRCLGLPFWGREYLP